MKESTSSGRQSAQSRVAKKSNTVRLISILLSIVLVATMVPALAFATGSEEPVVTGNEQGAEGQGGSDTGEGSGTEGENPATGEGTGEVIDDTAEPVITETSEGTATDEGTELTTADEVVTLEEEEELTTSAVSDDFSKIDVTFSPEKLQTYDDLKNNTVPSQLTAIVQIQPAPSYVANGRVEIPLDYNPTSQGLTNFTYGTDGTDGYGNTNGKETPDFLVLDEASLSSYIAQSNSLFTGYVIEDGILKLSLKSAADYSGDIAGVKTFQLVFSFNNGYNANIPANTVLWQPTPKVYVGDELAMTGSQKALMTGVTNDITYTISRQNPTTEEYQGGTMTVRVRHENFNYFESYLDTSYQNRIWVEYPAGTTFSTGEYPLGFEDDAVKNIDGSDYDRYYHNISNDPSTWTHWEVAGAKGQVFCQNENSVIIPDTIDVGDRFEVRVGADYRKRNGAEKNTFKPIGYERVAEQDWNLNLTSYHNTGGSTSASCSIDDGEIALASIQAPVVTYTHASALKNLGKAPVTGMEYTLYQASAESSKVNFDFIRLYATRDIGNPSDLPAWTSYAYKIMVTSVGGETTLGTSGTFTPTYATQDSQHIPLPLPTLTQGQYISSVIVTPMGTDGESPGELSPRNGFALRYNAKSWDGQKWPDGSKIENTRHNVPMAWSLKYDDAEGAAQSQQGNTAYVYYSSQPYAQANIISSEAPNGVNPGATVNYTLRGYNNDKYSGGSWANPKVIVRVPDVMTLKDVSQPKTLTDEESGSTSVVNAKLESTANGYKYYSFTAPGYTAPKKEGQNPVFSVPLQFEIASSAAPEVYSAPKIVVTSALGSTFYGSHTLPMNGELDANETLANYGLFESDNYSICTSPDSSVLDVIPSAQLDVNSAVASEATGGLYVTNSTVAAKHGETTTMKLTIKNGGNIDFSNVRLYNILPFSGDNLGSEGSITFAGLSVSGDTSPSIRYTESAGYPTYGAHGAEATGAAGTADLQASTFQDAWTSGNPSLSTKAFFVDFGDYVLAAGESVDIVLSFTVPKDGDQTAYNQFRFSAEQAGGSAAPLNQNAVAQGFSTKTIGLVYHDDLPALYASGGALEGTDDLSNIPDAHFASYIGATALTVDAAKIPSLTGYIFKGWATTAGDTTPTYQPGASVAFNQAGTVNLHPVWELASYQVSYTYENAPTSPTPPALPSTETKDFYSEVTVASVPTLTGYTFEGWTTLSAGVSITDNTFNMPANAVVFVGTWSESTETPYTVTHTKVDSKGATVGTPYVQNFSGTTGDTANATAYIYEGYTYDGTYDNTKASGTIAADGSLELFLYYPSNEHTLSFDKNADDATAGNVTTKKYRYAEAVGTLPSGDGAPSRAGYTFKGWSTTSGADNTADFTSTSTLSVDTDATVYAVWEANTTTPYTVNYYSVSTAGVASLIAAETVNDTGTTGATATATVKTITGHTYAEGYSSGTEDVEKLTGEIAGDGSLVLKVFYNVNTYAVSYSYSNAAPADAAEAPTTLNVAYGTTVTVATAPSVAGYSFSGWSTTDATISGSTFVMPAKAVALTGSWTALTGIDYKVEHYRLDVDGEPITGTPETEYLSGSTGDSVTATDKSYTGYTYASNYTGAAGTEKKSGTITADGKLTLKLFYTVNTHKVSYSTNTVPNMPNVPAAVTGVPYGKEMTVASALTLAGYDFSGWSAAGITGATYAMPDNDVAFTATWTAKNNTPYKVEYYTVDTTGAATLVSELTENNTGTTDATATAEIKTIAGHTYQASYDKDGNKTVASGTIKGNGSLVLKLYYTVNTYSVSYEYEGSVPDDAAAVPSKVDSVAYGTNVEVAAAPSLAGYSFSGWTTSDASVSGTSFDMPDNAVVFTGTWSALTDTPYAVEHYKVDELGAATLFETEHLDGETNTQALAESKTYTGYTYQSSYNKDGNKTVASGTITGDGKLVLKLYYTVNTYTVSYSYTNTITDAPELPQSATVAYGKTVPVAAAPSLAGYSFSGWTTIDASVSNTSFAMPDNAVAFTGTWTARNDTIYTVEHYTVDSKGAATLYSAVPLKGTTDTEAVATTIAITGHSYQKGYNKDGNIAVEKGNIDRSESLILKLYYIADSYTVSYEAGGGVGSVAPVTVYYNEDFSVAADNVFTRDGYTFKNYLDSKGNTHTAGEANPYTYTESITLTAQWMAKGDTAYATQHYLINANGVATLNHTEPGAGTTDTDAVAQARYYASHTFAANDARNITKANIKGDGTTVLKLYYNINYYTITFLDYNGATLATRSVPYGGSALAPANPARIGYTFIGWDRAFSNVTGSLSVNAQYRINTYTVTFVDYDGSVISTQSVAYGSSATAPANPTRTGYTFTGWNRSYTNVTSNITVTATYTQIPNPPVTTYTVTFLGYNDVVLQSSTVEEGESVTPPANPTRAGFRFTGWDKGSSAWTNVTADATVRATWNDERVTTTPTTVNPSGTTGSGTTSNATASELARAAEEQGIPNIGVPLAAPSGFEAWALANLILALLGIVLACVFAIVRRAQKSSDKEASKYMRSIGWIIGAAVLALISMASFVVTQDITLPMVWFDTWTILSSVLLIGVVILGNIAIGHKRRPAEDTAPQSV